MQTGQFAHEVQAEPGAGDIAVGSQPAETDEQPAHNLGGDSSGPPWPSGGAAPGVAVRESPPATRLRSATGNRPAWLRARAVRGMRVAGTPTWRVPGWRAGPPFRAGDSPRVARAAAPAAFRQPAQPAP